MHQMGKDYSSPHYSSRWPKLPSLMGPDWTGAGSVTKSCPTPYNPIDCTLSGSSVHGILHARGLEWVAVPSSRRSSPPGDQTCVFCISRIPGEFFSTAPLGKPGHDWTGLGNIPIPKALHYALEKAVYPPGLSWMLWISCLWPSPPKFVCWSPNAQCNGVWESNDSIDMKQNSVWHTVHTQYVIVIIILIHTFNTFVENIYSKS